MNQWEVKLGGPSFILLPSLLWMPWWVHDSELNFNINVIFFFGDLSLQSLLPDGKLKVCRRKACPLQAITLDIHEHIIFCYLEKASGWSWTSRDHDKCKNPQLPCQSYCICMLESTGHLVMGCTDCLYVSSQYSLYWKISIGCTFPSHLQSSSINTFSKQIYGKDICYHYFLQAQLSPVYLKCMGKRATCVGGLLLSRSPGWLHVACTT